MLVSSLVVPGWVAGAALLEVVGGLPLLTPMSEIAGRLSVQHASQILLQTRGVLLGGIAGVEPAHVVVVGAALDANPHLAQGVNVRGGEVVLEAIKTKT